MSTLYYETSNSLTHHGIKGQKWGVRRFQNEDGTLTVRGQMRYAGKSNIRKEYDSAKANYRKTKIIYDDDFNDAFNYSSWHGINQFIKGTKTNIKSDKRWDRAFESEEKFKTAKEQYKQAKKKRKDALDDNYREVLKNTSTLENLLYNNAYKKRVAKLLTDRDMSIDAAKRRAKQETIVNTAVVASIISAIGVYQIYKHRS